jgi:hypothetical protein
MEKQEHMILLEKSKNDELLLRKCAGLLHCRIIDVPEKTRALVERARRLGVDVTGELGLLGHEREGGT